MRFPDDWLGVLALVFVLIGICLVFAALAIVR